MRLQHRAALAASLLLSFGAVDRAAAADVLHLNWDDSCGSSCFNSHGAYSLTFRASSFSGPVDISKLLLDRRVLGDKAGSFFNVSFQLGGQSVGNWGQWNMGGVGGDELTLSGVSDLLWNPADGDLVLILQIVGANGQIEGEGQGVGGFSAAPPEDPPPHQDQPPGPGPGPDTDLGDFGGDITEGFTPPPGDLTPPGDPTSDGPPKSDDPPNSNTGHAVAAAPEPASWALMIGGFGLTGAALRRRKAAAAVA